MKWNKFQSLKTEPTIPHVVTPITIRQLGIAKVVFVRTKHNGGINRRQITVSEG